MVKRIEKNKNVVSISAYAQLKNVFKNNEWEIIENMNYGKFEKYFNLLKILNENEQYLILELTSRFLHINQPKYLQNIKKAINKLIDLNNSSFKI